MYTLLEYDDTQYNYGLGYDPGLCIPHKGYLKRHLPLTPEGLVDRPECRPAAAPIAPIPPVAVPVAPVIQVAPQVATQIAPQFAPQFTQSFNPQFAPQITVQSQSGPGTQTASPVSSPTSAPVTSPVSAPVSAPVAAPVSAPVQAPPTYQPVPSGQTTIPVSSGGGPAVPPGWLTPTQDGQAAALPGDQAPMQAGIGILAALLLAGIGIPLLLSKKGKGKVTHRYSRK